MIAVALLACGMLLVAAADTKLSSPSIALEIIVKFSRDSDAGRRIDGILKDHPEDLSRLGDLQEQLRQSIGFMLTPVRVTSGRELLVRIPEDPLLERIKESLSKRPEVLNTELIAIQDENPRLAESMLLVRFHPSADESALLNKAYAEAVYAGRVQALALQLCAASDVPVLGSAQAGAGLGLTVDRYALLEKLVTRLNNLADVDYAQANSTVQLMK
ncbi:MAG: hypothetical protein E4H01_08720 [Lysobacterales bacterium]|nr:MAG: hypothetical protein E4H01_08720 [Xanthomonadales bacterium]